MRASVSVIAPCLSVPGSHCCPLAVSGLGVEITWPWVQCVHTSDWVCVEGSPGGTAMHCPPCMLKPGMHWQVDVWVSQDAFAPHAGMHVGCPELELPPNLSLSPSPSPSRA